MQKGLTQVDITKYQEAVARDEHSHIPALKKLIETYLTNPKKLKDLSDVERAAKLRRLFAGMNTDKTEQEHSGTVTIDFTDRLSQAKARAAAALKVKKGK